MNPPQDSSLSGREEFVWNLVTEWFTEPRVLSQYGFEIDNSGYIQIPYVAGASRHAQQLSQRKAWERFLDEIPPAYYYNPTQAADPVVVNSNNFPSGVPGHDHGIDAGVSAPIAGTSMSDVCVLPKPLGWQRKATVISAVMGHQHGQVDPWCRWYLFRVPTIVGIEATYDEHPTPARKLGQSLLTQCFCLLFIWRQWNVAPLVTKDECRFCQPGLHAYRRENELKVHVEENNGIYDASGHLRLKTDAELRQELLNSKFLCPHAKCADMFEEGGALQSHYSKRHGGDGHLAVQACLRTVQQISSDLENFEEFLRKREELEATIVSLKQQHGGRTRQSGQNRSAGS
ncbi:hypothetical protein PSTG_07583 [Puccinia striiformis f. sp. tritici PST-78]|uniref:C2H2-type domain-containing protein n=1 Tax=Puccinia striiformis f. sp. tritici PST-78 TaxID=1165861 RepID=A0A0L0VIL5_9BASI|nr:hypothetical protein PSTG_07583 [Puccinia striiformis f. sp. tritici PST-78]